MNKSAVARSAIHYMLERKNFTGGAIFVTLKNLRYFRQMFEEIRKKIVKSVDLDYKNMRQ